MVLLKIEWIIVMYDQTKSSSFVLVMSFLGKLKHQSEFSTISQVGLSVEYLHPAYGWVRRINGGGRDESVTQEWWWRSLSAVFLLPTCLSFCTLAMNPEKLDGGAPGTVLAHPFHVKCFDGFSASPLNGIRMAFPSQMGTMGIDPTLPQMSRPACV